MKAPDDRRAGRSINAAMTVLIVNSKRDEARLCAAHLRAHGLDAVHDEDASADLLTPDVVIYGVSSGAEHTHAVCVVKAGRPVPIIAIRDDEPDRTHASTQDVASILIRPVDLDLLLREVQRLGGTLASNAASSPAGRADPEHVGVVPAVRMPEGRELRETAHRLRARSTDLRYGCERVQEKSADLLRESGSITPRLHRRS